MSEVRRGQAIFSGASDHPGSATAAPRMLASRSCTIQAMLKSAALKNSRSYTPSLAVVSELSTSSNFPIPPVEGHLLGQGGSSG